MIARWCTYRPVVSPFNDCKSEIIRIRATNKINYIERTWFVSFPWSWFCCLKNAMYMWCVCVCKIPDGIFSPLTFSWAMRSIEVSTNTSSSRSTSTSISLEKIIEYPIKNWRTEFYTDAGSLKTCIIAYVIGSKCDDLCVLTRQGRMVSIFVSELGHQQSGRSPKVVALFLLQTLVAI